MTAYFDHAFGFSGLPLAASIERLRAAGFRCLEEHAIRHRAGQHNAFVYLSGSYLELVTIADPARFEREALPYERALRGVYRPFGAVAATVRIADIQARLAAAYGALPALEYHTAEGAAAPEWAVLRVPPAVMPGAIAMFLGYLHEGMRAACRFRPSDNSIYAVGGLELVAADPATDPAAACARWARALAAAGVAVAPAGASLALGPQRLAWIDPAAYAARWGRAWEPAGEPPVGLCAVRLLCTSLERAARGLAAGGFTLHGDAGGELRASCPELGQWLVVEEAPDHEAFTAFVSRVRAA